MLFFDEEQSLLRGLDCKAALLGEGVVADDGAVDDGLASRHVGVPVAHAVHVDFAAVFVPLGDALVQRDGQAPDAVLVPNCVTVVKSELVLFKELDGAEEAWVENKLDARVVFVLAAKVVVHAPFVGCLGLLSDVLALRGSSMIAAAARNDYLLEISVLKEELDHRIDPVFGPHDG